jgi:hypothetical protein
MFEPTHIELAQIRYREQQRVIEQASTPVAGPGPIERLRMVLDPFVIAVGRQLQRRSLPQKIDH